MKDYTRMTREELEEELRSLRAGRQKAEPAPDLSRQDLHHLLCESQEYQIELEMRNRELVEARQQLDESRNHYLELYDFAPVGYVTLNDKGQIEEINLTGARMLGRERSSLPSEPFMTYVAGNDFDLFLDHLRRCRNADEEVITELSLTARGGREIPVQLVSVPAREAGQPAALFRTAMTDITDRKQAIGGDRGAVEELRRSEDRYRDLVENCGLFIGTHDAEGRILSVNQSVVQYCGARSAEELLGCRVSDFIPPDVQNLFRDYLDTVLTRGHARGTMKVLTPSGEVRILEYENSLRRDWGAPVVRCIGRDVTEQRRAEKRLREQAALLDRARDAIIVCDMKGRVLYWNQSAGRLYGWTAEEIVGQPLNDRLYLEITPEVLAAGRVLREKGEWVGELRHLTKGGQELIIEGHWTLVRDNEDRPKSILLINTDITEKKKLEAQFLRAQRLESIGTLASGIAHDLNNVLTPILMVFHLLQKKFTDDQSQRWLLSLRDNTRRGSDLIRQLLTFARGVSGERAPLPLAPLLHDLARMLSDTFPKSVEISCAAADGLRPVTGDATQLTQVLMNLCVNARDAMPHGGKLSIEAANASPGESPARPGTEAGHFVLITVTDTGTGIPPEHREKIFDPFFTTREVGQGTGLGLFTVSGIVKNHGGLIDVESAVGKGTRFRIYLPVTESDSPAQAAEEPTGLPAGHGELILVVDDENVIREIARETLEASGYNVLTARDGAEAVRQCLEHKGEVRAVLVDMGMPYVDGAATIPALRKIDPHLRIIVTSGLGGDDEGGEAASAGTEIFLPKPYSAERLLKILAEVLAS